MFSILQLSSGVEAGVILVLLFNPLWVLKTRLAVQGAEESIPISKRYAGLTRECISYAITLYFDLNFIVYAKMACARY